MSPSSSLRGRCVADIRAYAVATGHQREVELLLHSARVTPDAGATGRVLDVLEGEVDWPFFLDLARGHGVLPLVHRTLAGTGSDRVPAGVAHRLRSGAHAMAALVQFRMTELVSLLQLFEAHGVEALPFKGVALGAFAYGSPFRRKPGDYDILVRREHFERARALLVERGYRPRVPPKREARYLLTRAGSTFEHPNGSVDLHWTLEQQAFDSLPFSIKLDVGGVWERSVPIDLGGATVRTLSGEDALIYLCAHGARHAWAAFYSVCDVAEVIRATPDLDWARVGAHVQRHRMERVLHLGLLLACGLLDAELPEEVRAEAARNDQALALACEVSGWLFDPSSRAGVRRHTGAESVRHYRYHLNLLERPSQKVAYLFLRGVRKLSKAPRPAPTDRGMATMGEGVAGA